MPFFVDGLQQFSILRRKTPHFPRGGRADHLHPGGMFAKIIIWFVRIADIFYFCAREKFGVAGLHFFCVRKCEKQPEFIGKKIFI